MRNAALTSFAGSSFPVSGSITVALLTQRDTVCPSPLSPYLVLAIEYSRTYGNNEGIAAAKAPTQQHSKGLIIHSSEQNRNGTISLEHKRSKRRVRIAIFVRRYLVLSFRRSTGDHCRKTPKIAAYVVKYVA